MAPYGAGSVLDRHVRRSLRSRCAESSSPESVERVQRGRWVGAALDGDPPREGALAALPGPQSGTSRETQRVPHPRQGHKADSTGHALHLAGKLRGRHTGPASVRVTRSFCQDSTQPSPGL